MLEDAKLPDVPASWPGLYRWQTRGKYGHPHLFLQRWIEPRWGWFGKGYWEDVDEQQIFPDISGWEYVGKEGRKLIARVALKPGYASAETNTVMANRS